MNWFFCLSLLWAFSAGAISHKEFVKLKRDQREKILDAYLVFLKEYSKTVQISSTGQTNRFILIEEAYAADFDCLYGGWPSKRSRNLCSLPRSNPAFQREKCSPGEIPCQPLLFGRGICIGNTSTEMKRSTYQNCQKKFLSLGRKLSEVVEYISDPEISAEADELFQLIDEICRTGAQASTGMCRSLKNRVASILSQRLPQESRAEASVLATAAVANEVAKIETAIQDINSQTNQVSCEPTDSTQFTPFPRIDSGYSYAACGSAQSQDHYSVLKIFDCHQGSNYVPAGFSFSNGPGHPHASGKSPYSDGGPLLRSIEVLSRNHAMNETLLYLQDLAGGPDSHDVKSYMFIIPRKTVPSVKITGESIITTLATGETFTMNKESKAITGGALSEGPMSLTTDRFQRKPPNIHYVGTGISIRLDHRYEHPLSSSATATVKQGSKSCTISRTAILDENGKLRTQSDVDLLTVLNQSCRGGGFRLP